MIDRTGFAILLSALSMSEGRAMVNVRAAFAPGPAPRRPPVLSASSAAFWPARWPIWTLVPAAGAAFALGALVAFLTSGERGGPSGPVEVPVAVEGNDEADQLVASGAAAAAPSPDPAAVIDNPVDPVVRDSSPVVEPNQVVEPRRIADEAPPEPPEPVVAERPAPVASAPAARPSPSVPSEPDPSPPPDQAPAGAEAPVAPPRAAQPGGLRGTFGDPSGPVAGLTVKLLDDRSEVVLETVTSDDGVYELFPIPPGEYTVRFLRGQVTVYERPRLRFDEAQMRTLGVTSPTPIAPDTLPTGGR